uniref:Uncharacterized protein n=1 Tax=Arundo donax TaxID=35708 RepID=A0A0A8YG43_ARUDO
MSIFSMHRKLKEALIKGYNKTCSEFILLVATMQCMIKESSQYLS